MSGPPIKIVKVGETPAQQRAATRKSVPKSAPKVAPKVLKKTMRTFPRGVLKKKGGVSGMKAVADPAKSPPLASGRKATLRILTTKGAAQRRETIHKKVKTMSVGAVRDTLRRSGLPISDKTPPHIAKEILEGGMEAGMIVST